MATRETYNNAGELIAVEIIPDPPAPALLPLDIVALFTPSELLALEQSTDLRVVAFRVQFFSALNPIALDDPRFVAAVAVMESAGILSAARAADVLANRSP